MLWRQSRRQARRPAARKRRDEIVMGFACSSLGFPYHRKTKAGSKRGFYLEQQLQRELDLPRGGDCVSNLAGRLAVTIVSAVALEYHLIRESEIHVIQNIERFRAELQRYALPDGDPLKQGRVEVEQARAAERTAPRVPEGAGKRHRESTGIKPVVHAP